ncbi:MAG: PaREP1 family protein [Candidatus Bathyarchaeia archaeon]
MSVTSELPERLVVSLRRMAEETDLSVEEIVADAVASYLKLNSPDVKAEIHSKLCEKYLNDGRKLLDEGDYPQASEKFWGATTQMVKALGAKRGETLDTYAKLWGFVGRLVEETRDKELRRLWAGANALHKNFYEVQLPPELVKGYVNDAEELIAKLKKIP